MDATKLRAVLEQVQGGRLSLDEAVERLRSLPYEDLGFAKVDTHRALRQGLPEVVFCQGKTADQAAEILATLWSRHDRVMGTRVAPDMAEIILRRLPEARYHPIPRLITLARAPAQTPVDGGSYVLVACAGTADMPVAEEAAITLEFAGDRCIRAYDVGVAGIHRLLDQMELLVGADVIISVAGMEGALTSVIGGLVACPVIGVPTSVGYGANFGGLAPLLTMLNSCAPGVSVVNIDNGFGAAVTAHTILSRIAGRKPA